MFVYSQCCRLGIYSFSALSWTELEPTYTNVYVSCRRLDYVEASVESELCVVQI